MGRPLKWLEPAFPRVAQAFQVVFLGRDRPALVHNFRWAALLLKVWCVLITLSLGFPLSIMILLFRLNAGALHLGTCDTTRDWLPSPC